MTRFHFAAGLALLLICFVGTAFAQTNTASQTVNFSVASFQQISVAAGPVALTIDAWTGADDNLTPATGASTYSILQNVGTCRITAQLNSDMPTGTTLQASLVPHTGRGTGLGLQTLTTSPVTVVNGIPRGADNAAAINYSFSATASAGAVSDTRIVTFTLVNP